MNDTPEAKPSDKTGNRLHQVVFILSLIGFCWFAMQTVHELGHVIGALVSGGQIRRVILHPLSISQTDVAPNPNPSLVVWLGPIIGSILPLAAWLVWPRVQTTTRKILMFFAGFCLVANGGYIAIGAMDRVGDCAVMLDNGSPLWTLILFGALVIPGGLFVWHRLGSIQEFLADPTRIDQKTSYVLAGLVVVMIVAGSVFSPR